MMTCRLFRAKPISKRMLGYCQLDPQEQASITFLSKYKMFIHENAYENNVCEMTTIFVQVVVVGGGGVGVWEIKLAKCRQ